MSQPIAMVEIARRAGCSTGTVSRVLNGGRVAVETRERVLAIMRETGYRPKYLANRGRRALITGSFDGLAGAYQAAVFAGLSQRAAERGLQVLLCDRAGCDLRGLLEEQRADALVSMGHRREDLLALAAEGRCVLALGDWQAAPEDLLLAGNDAAASARLSLEPLLAAGHRRLACIATAARRSAAEHFCATWSQVCARGGVDGECIRIDSAEGVTHAILRLYERSPRPTGLVLERPHFILPALQACWRLGWRVPDRLSLVAREDERIAPFAIPPITAVGFDNRALGRHALDLIADRLEGVGSATTHHQSPVLIARDSIRAPEPCDG